MPELGDYRVGVTGSRTWWDEKAVFAALDAERRAAARAGYRRMVVIYGKNPHGADRQAERYCLVPPPGRLLVSPEPHPADWQKFGRAAGARRNQEMVDSGAERWLAFLDWCARPECPRRRRRGPHRSHGAADCAARAEAAGIEVLTWLAP